MKMKLVIALIMSV